MPTIIEDKGMTHDEMIAVIEHHKKGGKVEIRPRHSTGRWCDVSAPSWSFADSEYRIKPEAVMYRVALFKDSHGVYFCLAETSCEDLANAAGFVRWVTDWVEVVE